MLKAGQIIKGYEIKHLLAYGGMAEVYLAHDITGKKVAIKRLLPFASNDKAYLELFLNEADILKKLKHDNIARYIDFFSEKDDYFLISEFVLGKNLNDILNSVIKKKPKQRDSIAVAIMLQACQALLHIHSKGILHNDISLSNIMMDIQGQIKLIDFGIARDVSCSEKTCFHGLIQGKVGFFSPEMLTGGKLTQKSDIFSLGLTFLCLQKGKPIFINKTEKQIFNIILNGNLEYLVDIENLLLKNIILKMINITPEKRYENCREILQDLKSISMINSLERSQKYLKQFFVSSSNYNNKNYIAYYLTYFFFLSLIVLLGIMAKNIAKSNLTFSVLDKPAFFPEIANGKEAFRSLPKEEKFDKDERGFLLLEAEPWANVYIDDQFMGATPLQKIALVPGTYVVRLVNPNFREQKVKIVNISMGKNSMLKVKL